MKQFVLSAFLWAVTAFSMNSQAQSSLSNFFSNLFGSSQNNTVTTVTSVFNHLIGNTTVTSTSLVGTWTYSQPAVAFESQNLLGKAGGAVTANVLEKKLGNALTTYGFKPGNSTLTFNADSTFSMRIKGRTVTGRYSVSKSTLTLRSRLGTTLVTANVAIASNQLQLTFTANKLLTFVKQVAALSTTSTTLNTISQLAGNYSGMQLGLQFKKK